MPAVWQLEYGATRQPLKDWGIDAAVLNRFNLDADELVLSAPVSSITNEPIFAAGGEVSLWLYLPGEEPACRFRGHFDDLPGDDDSEQHRQRYIAKSAWVKLERILYEQIRVQWNDSFTALVGAWTPRVVLGQDNWGHRITTNQQIYYISLYALQQGGSLFVLGDLPTLTETWFQEAQDLMCADAIKLMIAMTPDCAGFMNYTANPPVLAILRRASLPVVTLDLADKNLVVTLKPRPRYDLLLRGVVFNFVQQVQRPSDGRYYDKVTKQVAGFTTGEKVVKTRIELTGQGGPQAETVPSGVAAAYLASRNVLHWEFSMQLKEAYCSGRVQVGTAVNITGGRAAWEDMFAMVQSTQEDLFNGTTNVQLGPPEHLGPQDFASLMSNFRRRPTPTDFPEKRHNGDEGVDPADGNPGTNPDDPDAGAGANPDNPGGAGNDQAGASSSTGAGSSSGQSEPITHCVDGIQRTTNVRRA